MASVRDRLVVFLSHYPILVDSLAGGHETSIDEHYAVRLQILLGRLKDLGHDLPMLFFHGDVHRPVQRHYVADAPGKPGNPWAHFFVTGHFDAPQEGKAALPMPRNARFIRVDLRAGSVDDVLMQYRPRSWGPEMHLAQWEPDPDNVSRPPPKAGRSRRSGVSRATGEATDRSRPPGREAERKRTVAGHTGSPPADVSRSIADIRDIIDDELGNSRLLELRRVRTTDEYDRLVHIKLGPLMNHPEVMPQVIHEVAGWIREEILPAGPRRVAGPDDREPVRSTDSPGVILLGLDCWGACMAAEIGFRAGVMSLGLTIRGLSDDDLATELSGREIVDSITHLKARRIVLVTDVVVSGSTVLRARRKLIEALESRDATVLRHPPDFWLVALLQARANPSSRAELHAGTNGAFTGTFVIYPNIRIPVVHRDDLPPDDQMPAFDFNFDS